MRITPILAMFACSAACMLAQAQSYPTKPIFIVYPYSSGGGMDNFVRAFGLRVSDAWGQPVHVEYKPGANSIIGTDYVVKSPADGYMLLMSGPALYNNVALYSKLPYDWSKDLVPVTGLGTFSFSLIVTPSFPAKTLTEYIELAKARPGQVSYASIGIGSAQHLAMELLLSMAGIKLNHIPYKGGAQALSDVSAGHVESYFVGLSTSLPFIKTGKVRVLAYGSSKRASQAPDLPTVAESVPGYEMVAWFGLHAPTGTPRGVVEKINAEAQKITADSAFREKYVEPLAYETLPGSPEQFAAFLKADALKWGKVIRDAGVKLD